MRRLPLKCEVCEVELSGGLDTFGAVGEERCFRDHFSVNDSGSLAEAFEQANDEWVRFSTDEDIQYLRNDLKYAVEDLTALESDPDVSGSEKTSLSVRIEKYKKEINELIAQKEEAPHRYEEALYWDRWWRETAVRS